MTQRITHRMPPPARLVGCLVLATATAAAQDQRLTDSGFEADSPRVGTDPVPGPGIWFGDLATPVEAERDLSPAEGSRMLRFDASVLTLPGGSSGDVWQIVPVEDWAVRIDDGRAAVRVATRFNRVPGGPLTDTRFGVGVRSYAAMPTSGVELIALATKLADERFDSDGDATTWEVTEARMRLPAGTRYIALAISALQDVSRTPPPDFDGHYADAASLVLLEVERCVADVDLDADLTLFDFLAFQNLFDAGDPAADFDGDGSLTLFDFLAFQNQFDAGCP